MRFITTRTHGYLDYIVGIALILAPFIFGFATGGPEMWVPIALGIGAIVYSMVTNYELGVVKSLPMRTHLTLDLVSGLFLAVSPWLLDYAHIVWVPHVLVGLLEVGAALTTQTVPGGITPSPTRRVG